VDASTALRRIRIAEKRIKDLAPFVARRVEYTEGKQDLPFAPYGIIDEYDVLRKQAVQNLTDMFVRAPVQRLRQDSMHTGMPPVGDEKVDDIVWRDIFQANQWDTRQSRVYRSMVMHGRGLVSVWPNESNRERPIMRPESFGSVHVEMDPEDPFEIGWVGKIITVETDSAHPASVLVLPAGMTRTKQVGFVYDAERVIRLEKGGVGGGSEWVVVDDREHPMGEVPFARYDLTVRDDGTPYSALDHMMVQQDALNTIRFNTLLAMQFAAYRQKIVSGFDPRVRDKDGNIVYRTNSDGTPMVDASGQQIPILNSPGRAGVDRMLVFPGTDTKVYDLPESNLKNYIEVLTEFQNGFFASGQIPPQYAMNRMANLSGDALAGAESTFASLLSEIKLAAGEGNEKAAELAWKARGMREPWNPAAESQFADSEARSFAQIVDGIGKLRTDGFPRRAAWEMIPGATAQKVDRWIEESDDEAFTQGVAGIKRSMFGALPRELAPQPQEA
jgi:hypothetical protein